MRRIVLAITAILALALLASTGCATGTMTDEQLEQAVEKVLAANGAIKFSSFDLTMEATIVNGLEEAQLSGTGIGTVDSVNQRMHLSMEMTVVAPGQDKIDLPVEYYLVDGLMYFSISTPEQGVQWIKMGMPEGMWEQQDQVQQQLDLLKTATEVNYLGTRDVAGVKCYAIEIVPDLASLQEMVAQAQGQMSGLGDLDLSSMDLGQMMKEVSVTQYIATDSYLIMQTDEHIVMEITPEAMGLPDEAFDLIMEDITTTIVFRDYEKPVTIQLPQGALAAIEMS